ncbi:8233_t:CDS:2 [Entrophospora sp. SA101]|nr:8233_t:CDS:2 [Entrophospora sp. SA101]
MATTGHGPQLKKTGTGGYTLSASGAGGNFDISVAGTGALEGLLLYVVNPADNTKTGKFNIADPAFQPCNSDPSAVTHTSKTVKKLPLKFNWSSSAGAKTGSVTVRAIVVEKSKTWYSLQDVTFNLEDGFLGWIKKYSLFVILIALTTILYVIGSIVELMLKKQNIKARSFAKTVGGFVNPADNTKTGKFNIADPAFQPCNSDPSAVTHTSKTVKKLPLKFNWSSSAGAKTGSVTVRAIVVEKSKTWYSLQDVTFNLEDGFLGWIKKYSLFVILIALTTILYVIGSIVELMLKKQNIKARSFAKTVGGFGIAK